MFLLYHAYVYLEFLILACTIYILAPSVSVAVRGLLADGYVIKDRYGSIELTEEGRKIAKKIYARHVLLEEFLRRIGVSSETANHDACRMEHTISEESYKKIQELVRKMKEENTLNEEMKLTN